MSSSSSDVDDSGGEEQQRVQIREELSTMTFEEIMKLKEELGAKVYKEAVLGVEYVKKHTQKGTAEFTRLNKNRPRELSAKRQVPFLGAEKRTSKNVVEVRDPRFDERSGTYDVKNFKENYKFLSKIRGKEVRQLKKQLTETTDAEDRGKIKETMQRLINKNVEERKWHVKQATIKQEQQEIQKAHDEGRQPHYITKKERRTQELVKQFDILKKTGKLNKHLEKRRKKNAAKDRKKFSFD